MQFISILILQKSILTGEKARQVLAEDTGGEGPGRVSVQFVPGNFALQK